MAKIFAPTPSEMGGLHMEMARSDVCFKGSLWLLSWK